MHFLLTPREAPWVCSLEILLQKMCQASFDAERSSMGR
jgi:hypothetical protein